MTTTNSNPLIIPVAKVGSVATVPNCVWTHLFPSNHCTVSDYTIQFTLTVLTALIPGKRFRFVPKINYYSRPGVSRENDSSELGALRFGLADVTVPYYTLDYSRRGYLKGLIGPIGFTTRAAFYPEELALPRKHTNRRHVLHAIRPLFFLLILRCTSQFLNTAKLHCCSKIRDWNEWKTVIVLLFLLSFGQRLCGGWARSHLILLFNSVQWKSPTADLAGLTELLEGGGIKVGMDYGNVVWPMRLGSKGGSEVERRFKRYLSKHYPADIPYSSAMQLLVSNRNWVYLGATTDIPILTGSHQCGIKMTSLPELNFGFQVVFSRLTPSQHIHLGHRHRAVFADTKRRLNIQRAIKRAMFCPLPPSQPPPYPLLTMGECAVFFKGSIGVVGVAVFVWILELIVSKVVYFLQRTGSIVIS